MTEKFLVWIKTNIVDYDEKVENDKYINKEMVDIDLKNIEDTFGAEPDKGKRIKAERGFKTIKEDFLKDDLYDAVDTLNEKKETEIQQTLDVDDLQEIDVSGYEKETIQTKRQVGRTLTYALTKERRLTELIEIEDIQDLRSYGITKRAGVSSFMRTFSVSEETAIMEVERLRDLGILQ